MKVKNRNFLRYVDQNHSKPTSKKSTYRARRTFYNEPVEHSLSAYKSIPGTRKNYCYMFKAGADHFYYRKYTCMTCENCRSFKTDPFSGSVKCSRERIAGPWKKGYFQRKKARKKAPVEESCDEEDESSS